LEGGSSGEQLPIGGKLPALHESRARSATRSLLHERVHDGPRAGPRRCDPPDDRSARGTRPVLQRQRRDGVQSNSERPDRISAIDGNVERERIGREVVEASSPLTLSLSKGPHASASTSSARAGSLRLSNRN